MHSVLVYLLNLKYSSGLFRHFSMILEFFSGFKSVGEVGGIFPAKILLAREKTNRNVTNRRDIKGCDNFIMK